MLISAEVEHELANLANVKRRVKLKDCEEHSVFKIEMVTEFRKTNSNK